MAILLASSLSARVNKQTKKFNPATLRQLTFSSKKAQNADSDGKRTEKRSSVASKLLDSKPLAPYRQHTLYYVLKSFGYLPAPLLERWISYLKGPNTKQYLHADAHLRLIIAINGKFKKPLHLSQLPNLRKKFAEDVVAMQTPKVWQQGNQSNKLLANAKFNQLKLLGKEQPSTVSWQDKTIANADDGDMTIRCYEAQSSQSSRKGKTVNPDDTVMLFFHGGGFCIGDIDTHHEFCHAFCQRTGWPVVSVDYRLAPEHAAPTALRDCISAYAWLAEHCHKLGASPARIVLAGDSAGGCLATLVAQQVAKPSTTAWLDIGLEGQKTFKQLQDLPAPIAQMPMYPVTDVEIDYPSWGLYGQGLLLDHDDVEVFDAAYMQGSLLPRRHALVSPMCSDSEQICPTYIIAAELDILRDQALAYAQRLQSHGIDVQTYTVLGAPHGFVNFMSVHQGIGRETNYIIDEFATFVRRLLLTDTKASSNEQKLLAS